MEANTEANTEFTWIDLLTLAEEWFQAQPISSLPAARYRSIISRAYYAVYHIAEPLAIQQGMAATPSASNHYRVRTFFRDRGRLPKQLSFTLTDLYDLRIAADYEIIKGDRVTDHPHASARKALDLAHKALELIGSMQPKNK